nr:MAG TPA: hypothetical protein [Caudoviricetes sp.]
MNSLFGLDCSDDLKLSSSVRNAYVTKEQVHMLKSYVPI